MQQDTIVDERPALGADDYRSTARPPAPVKVCPG